MTFRMAEEEGVMAMSTCGECGGQVSTTALQCPHCGCTFCKTEGCTAPASPGAQGGGATAGYCSNHLQTQIQKQEVHREKQSKAMLWIIGLLVLGGFLFWRATVVCTTYHQLGGK